MTNLIIVIFSLSTHYSNKGYFGRILCTGDFRINDKMLQNPILKNLADSKVIIFLIHIYFKMLNFCKFAFWWCLKKSLDVLYVDNTFEEIGNDFKTREECLQSVLKIVKY